MTRNHSRNDDEGDINLTPMLDIVFIMLIFFIVTATFVKETGLKVEKPVAVTAEPEILASILVAVSEEGEIWVERRPVELGALRSVIAALFAENPRGAMSIQADADSPARVIVDIVEEARLAGVQNIIVSTVDP
ncbi:MAG: biopolymer transporter ExbD [Proteobacteria bacterium]|nr:biopolymer transporter ExbD [Pseudomonadota bacterium]